MDYKLIRFCTIILFSLIAIAIGVAGLSGAFRDTNPSLYFALITLVLGIWVKIPKLRKRSGADALFDSDTFSSSDPSPRHSPPRA